jgi:hypothetical protein
MNYKILLGVLLLIAAAVGLYFYFKKDPIYPVAYDQELASVVYNAIYDAKISPLQGFAIGGTKISKAIADWVNSKDNVQISVVDSSKTPKSINLIIHQYSENLHGDTLEFGLNKVANASSFVAPFRIMVTSNDGGAMYYRSNTPIFE